MFSGCSSKCVIFFPGTNLSFYKSWWRRGKEERRGTGRRRISIFPNQNFLGFPHFRQQQRQVSKVLLDGLYDEESPLSKLHGSLRHDVMGEIIWKQMLLERWQVFPDHQ